MTGVLLILSVGYTWFTLNDRYMELRADIETTQTDREYYSIKLKGFEFEIIGLGAKYVGISSNSYDMDVMGQTWEDI